MRHVWSDGRRGVYTPLLLRECMNCGIEQFFGLSELWLYVSYWSEVHDSKSLDDCEFALTVMILSM